MSRPSVVRSKQARRDARTRLLIAQRENPTPLVVRLRREIANQSSIIHSLNEEKRFLYSMPHCHLNSGSKSKGWQHLKLKSSG